MGRLCAPVGCQNITFSPASAWLQLHSLAHSSIFAAKADHHELYLLFIEFVILEAVFSNEGQQCNELNNGARMMYHCMFSQLRT